MQASKKKRRATYQDVIDSPEYMVAELIGGELRLSNRPGGPATAVASAIGHKLGSRFDDGRRGRGRWQILWEPELHLGDEIVVPDLAGWRIERLEQVPDEAFVAVRPDWICEVPSRSTEKMDRTEKMPLYAASSVPYAWLVHPRKRILEAFRLEGSVWRATGTYKDTDRVRIEPFDAIELDLAALWARVPLATRASEEPAHYDAGGY